MHAKSGGNLEIMGMLQGKIVGNTFIVLDAFALPVEGTETRVNAQAEAYEFMIDFFESNKVMELYSEHSGAMINQSLLLKSTPIQINLLPPLCTHSSSKMHDS